jgi:hypothetical protein
MDDLGEEGMDTLSELCITGARARGDGAGGFAGRGSHPIWLQGRDRKQGGAATLGAGVVGAGRVASHVDVHGESDSSQLAGGQRRRGGAGVSTMRSTVHEDQGTTPHLQTVHVGPDVGQGAGAGPGRGRRMQAGKAAGGLSGSSLRHTHHAQPLQHHDPVRDSWDSLTLFARGHAGRLAPSINGPVSLRVFVCVCARCRGGGGAGEKVCVRLSACSCFCRHFLVRAC